MEPKKDQSLVVREGFALPRIIAEEGRKAQNAFVNFFTATIENTNTRRAYARAVRDFFSFISDASAKFSSRYYADPSPRLRPSPAITSS